MRHQGPQQPQAMHSKLKLYSQRPEVEVFLFHAKAFDRKYH